MKTSSTEKDLKNKVILLEIESLIKLYFEIKTSYVITLNTELTKEEWKTIIIDSIMEKMNKLE